MCSSLIYWCSSCVNASTRPRIAFDGRGRCNACSWSERKRDIDWSTRKDELAELLARFRSSDGSYDCVVPVSGGKDGSYVSYQLKRRYGMNPITVTVTPPLETELGRANLNAFISSGFDHVQIDINPTTMRRLNRSGFEVAGFPYFGWLTAITSAVLSFAARAGVSLVFYGEDGEVEYGGSTETASHALYGIDYIRRVYLEGFHSSVITASGVTESDLNQFRFPDGADADRLAIAHWSYFENWDPYRNYLVAKEHCGLREALMSNTGTFTNFAQNDQSLYPLHTYLMYLKFGFCRATQDAGIEIRRGAMTREQGVNLVRLYDDSYETLPMDLYLEYFEMTQPQFASVLARHVNTDLFEWRAGRWAPRFTVG